MLISKFGLRQALPLAYLIQLGGHFGVHATPGTYLPMLTF